MNFDLRDHTILLTIAGSRAYGIHTDASDVDVKGVAIPPAPYFHGYAQRFAQADKPGHVQAFLGDLSDEERAVCARTKLEGSVYDLVKFIKLAADANPNILEVLFCREAEVRIANPLGRLLRERRALFLSAKAKHTYAGYAASQLRRIKGHRRWLLDPPVAPPTRAAYGLPEQTLIPADQLAAARAAVQKRMDQWEIDFGVMAPAEVIHLQDHIRGYLAEIMATTDARWRSAARTIGLDENLIAVMQREREYQAAQREWKQFQTWKKHRNPARAALEAKHGFDCYVDDTEFLTDSGWKHFDDIGSSDRLATVYVGPPRDLRTWGAVEYQEPLERFDGTFSGNLYHFTGHHTDVLVTPNHRMLSRRVEKNTGRVHAWELEEASRLTNCFDVLRTVTPRTKRYSNGDRFEGLPVPEPTYMMLMGWFLSDGTFTFRDGKVRDVRISQVKGGKLSWSMAQFQSRFGEAVQSALYEYERAPDKHRSTACVERSLCLRHPVLRERLYDDCGHAEAKRIPRWVFGLSRRLMERLLDAMMRGDGAVRQTNLESLVYDTSLEGLADDVQELALMCGFEAARWGPFKTGDRPGRMYQVHVNKEVEQHRRLKRSRSIQRVPVEGRRIVCFTVPNGTLITRRNGRVAIHGNSKHGSHLFRLLRQAREILEKGEVNVWRGGIDAEEILAIRHGGWSYERLVEWAEAEDAALGALYRERAYVVPRAPDRAAIDRLCCELVEAALAGNVSAPGPTQ